jgi:serine/threonine protein phosphatase PrpC
MSDVDCPSCADERAAGAAFCEECGRQLAAPAAAESAAPLGTESGQAAAGAAAGDAAAEGAGAPCPNCGTPGAIAADGYCSNCGMLAFRPRDHIEIDAAALAAAVTDRGLRHHRNEDAVFLATRGSDVDVVVCDGVSSSFDPDVASAEAVEIAGALLAAADADLQARVSAAISAAGSRVASLAASGDPRRAVSNPACTIVAACVRGAEIGYGWVGDSRAYWIPAEGDGVQLTEDDSWATHAIGLGMDPDTAMRDPKAHAITGWLGADAGPIVPRTGLLAPTVAGHLVVCSDGLWNYLPHAAEFVDTVRDHLAKAASETAPLLAAARSLTAYANAAGGADNITVALIPVGPAEPQAPHQPVTPL